MKFSRAIFLSTSLILCAATPKGGQVLMALAKKGQRQKTLAAMVPPLPPTNVVLRAVIPPRPAAITNVYMTFEYHDKGLDARSNILFQVAWTTNLPAAQHTTTFLSTNNPPFWPRGWSHYTWTTQLTNTFRNTNREAYFILRASNTITHWVSPWVTK